MFRQALVVVFAVSLLTACGGSNNAGTAANDVPQPNVPPVNAGGAANKAPDKRANAPVEKKPDPNLFKKVTREDPAGWHKLHKDGQAEVLGHTKLKADRPANYEFVAAISQTKEPGPTAGKEEWDKWGRGATTALLYFIDKAAIEPVKALNDNAAKVAAGVPDPKIEGGVAWAALQGGEVVLAAFNLAHGTYIVVGIVLDTENVTAHTQTIVTWAKGVKAEKAE